MKIDCRIIIERLLYITCYVGKILLAPIIKNKVFLVNIILLLIIPSIINAYWLNKIKNGSSFPYILFIPFTSAYLLGTIYIIANYVNCYFSKILKVFVYCFFMVLFAVNVFLLLNFNTMISPSIIQLLIETNTNETSEFLETYLFNKNSIISYLITLIMIGYLIYSEKKQRNTIENRYLIVACICIAGYLLQRSINPMKCIINLFECENLSAAEYWYLTYPVNTNTLSNFVYSTYIMHLSKQEISNATHSTLSFEEEIESNDDLTIVLIIGESFNKHHSSLYGYYNKTNPRLQEQVNQGNLFVFTDVISSYNLTSFVIRNLFSVNSIMDNEVWTDYPAFPILFRKSGYNVYLWDNQRTFGKADVSDFSISSYLFNDSIMQKSYSAYNKKVFQYDGQLVSDFWHRIRLSGKRNLIIFHLMGQHSMPYKRYPKIKEFCVFTKDSIKRVDIDDKRKTQIAYYDNATLYNDWVVCNIMNHYKDDNAVVVYFPDHGEEIFDYRDCQGRTHETEKTPELLKYQYEIPFMIWCSNKYKESHPVVVSNILLAKDKPFMNDNVSQILMGLARMNTHYYNPKRDLISPQYEPYSHRNVQNVINYERIRYGSEQN